MAVTVPVGVGTSSQPKWYKTVFLEGSETTESSIDLDLTVAANSKFFQLNFIYDHDSR